MARSKRVSKTQGKRKRQVKNTQSWIRDEVLKVSRFLEGQELKIQRNETSNILVFSGRSEFKVVKLGESNFSIDKGLVVKEMIGLQIYARLMFDEDFTELIVEQPCRNFKVWKEQK